MVLLFKMSIVNMLDLEKTHLTVRKSNELIEARYKLTIGEQRLILLLATQIRKDDEDFKDYEIRVDDFARMFDLGTSSSLYEKVEQAADSLLGKVITLKSDEETEKTTWLSYIKYINGSGKVRLRFDKSLKPYLLQLNKSMHGFTQYNLKTVINFKSSYSIRLYELLKMEVWKYEKIAKNQFEKKFDLAEYRLLMGIEKKAYPVFADFKKRVIEPTIKEVSEQTELAIIDVRYIKTSRKITGLVLVVQIRTQKTAPENTVALLETSSESSIPENHPLINQLIELGFSESMAKAYKNQYGIQQIERNITYALAKKRAGLIKDFPAYLNIAIKEDLGNAWEVEQAQQAAEQTQRQAEAAKREVERSTWEKHMLAAHDKKMAAMLAERGLSVSLDRDELKALLAQLIGAPQEANHENER